MTSNHTNTHGAPEDARPTSPTMDDLQALLDRSLAQSSALVNQWMAVAPPVTGPVPQGESDEQVRQWRLRPPRLGLGAPIPTAQRQQETASLTQLNRQLHKSSGVKRKRSLSPDSSQTKGKKKANEEESDEEESRSKMAGSSKKPIIGGMGRGIFDTPHEKGKSRKETTAASQPVTSASNGPHVQNSVIITDVSNSTRTLMTTIIPSETASSADVLDPLPNPTSTPKPHVTTPEGEKKKNRRKKKKKTNALLKGAVGAVDLEGEEDHGEIESASVADSASVTVSVSLEAAPAVGSPSIPLIASTDSKPAPPSTMPTTPERKDTNRQSTTPSSSGRRMPNGWRAPMIRPDSESEDGKAENNTNHIQDGEGLEEEEEEWKGVEIDVDAEEDHVQERGKWINGKSPAGQERKKRKKKKLMLTGDRS